MRRPRLADLCCRAGGAGKGYHDAGFEVVGVDIEPQPNYPFEFHQADALTFSLDGFDAVHASPPCQGYSDLRFLHPDKTYPDIVGDFRTKLMTSGIPFVIENVVRAPLINPVLLCGTMFGLGTEDRDLYRHRKFESNVRFSAPRPCKHDRLALGVYGHGGGKGSRAKGRSGSLSECCEAMGIDWMTRAELSQAIPPAYTEHIGRALMVPLR
jgi:DNA (cytosine-5)-methyltransferase 1